MFMENNMNYKVPGIIGGVGPASTLDYYNDIVNGYREITKDDSYPNLIIKSVDMTKMLSYLGSNDYSGLVDFLRSHIQNLKDAGAEFAAIASNTPHIVYEELVKVSPLPLVSIVESTCNYAVKNNYKSVLILGTKFTMQSTLYTSAFEKHNIKAVVPNIDAVVLGFTEIPIMIKQGDLNCPVLNTTEIHVRAILKKMF